MSGKATAVCAGSCGGTSPEHAQDRAQAFRDYGSADVALAPALRKDTRDGMCLEPVGTDMAMSWRKG
jgi:hypothetical protein